MQQKRYSSDVTERQWTKLAPLFVVQRTSKWPLRAVIKGIFYVLKQGCVWRDVPADLPPGPTVYYYFTKWSVNGTWQRISACLTVEVREQVEITPSPRPPPSTAKA